MNPAMKIGKQLMEVPLKVASHTSVLSLLVIVWAGVMVAREILPRIPS
jgi:hypothetical protein